MFRFKIPKKKTNKRNFGLENAFLLVSFMILLIIITIFVRRFLY